MRKCANFSPYMRRPLVIHDFAPDPSEFLIYEENLFFLPLCLFFSNFVCFSDFLFTCVSRISLTLKLSDFLSISLSRIFSAPCVSRNFSQEFSGFLSQRFPDFHSLRVSRIFSYKYCNPRFSLENLSWTDPLKQITLFTVTL